MMLTPFLLVRSAFICGSTPGSTLTTLSYRLVLLSRPLLGNTEDDDSAFRFAGVDEFDGDIFIGEPNETKLHI
jgi:hypothetical protein